MSRKSPKTKQSLYFPEDMLEEIRQEAKRLDRSMSWLIQRTWEIAKKNIMAMPGENDTE